LSREALAERAQPATVNLNVVVGECDDRSGGDGESTIAGRRDPGTAFADDPDAGEIQQWSVTRTVVDDDHLVVRVVELRQAVNATP